MPVAAGKGPGAGAGGRLYCVREGTNCTVVFAGLVRRGHSACSFVSAGMPGGHQYTRAFVDIGCVACIVCARRARSLFARPRELPDVLESTVKHSDFKSNLVFYPFLSRQWALDQHFGGDSCSWLGNAVRYLLVASTYMEYQFFYRFRQPRVNS